MHSGCSARDNAHVTLEAVALNVARSDRELVAGLGIETEIGLHFVRQPTSEFEPRRMVEQWHGEIARRKLRRRGAAPILPGVETPVGLPETAMGSGIVHCPRTPSRPVAPDVEPSATVIRPSFA